MSLPSNALQAAIYDRLSDQVGGAAIYDHVNQQTPFPYVDIGSYICTEWDTKNKRGWRYAYTIHVWAKSAGHKLINSLIAEVESALDRQEDNIRPAGYTVTQCNRDTTNVLQEFGNEGERDHYYHGVINFNILIEPTT